MRFFLLRLDWIIFFSSTGWFWCRGYVSHQSRKVQNHHGLRRKEIHVGFRGFSLSNRQRVCSSRNVPLPELSVVERAEIEKKASEIETGKRTEDVDEDDAGKSTRFAFFGSEIHRLFSSGVKRPAENYVDDGNSNTKNTRANRTDFLYDNDYNSSR